MREDSGVAPGLTGLPSGDAGISPLGDRFQPDLVRGTGSYAVKIRCPKGPNGTTPDLRLTYSTGGGHGPFGLGWRLSTTRIERRTDRGLPRYTDDDTFVLGDAEILVPVGGGRFRPKTDTQFWSIERIGDGWRVRTGDGRTRWFGRTEDSREFAGDQVFAWHLDGEEDAAGNAITYTYLRDGNSLYLQEVSYSIFRVRFGYEPRPDVIRNGRAGFPRTIALRGNTVELHCDRLAPTLMSTHTLSYDRAANGASVLTGVGLSATDGTETAHLPSLKLGYTPFDLTDWDVRELEAQIPPPGLDDPRTQLVDMSGDGLPDVLQSHGARMLLWRNRGDGRFEGPSAIEGVPTTVSLERDNVAFADLTGNGRVDLFAVDQPLQIAFASNGRGGFEAAPIVFRDSATLRLDAPDTRLMDVDGDGVVDLIDTGRDNFLLFRHQAGVGFQQPEAIQRIPDLERFPDLTLGDRGVHLADMTGDGLQDFVSARSGDFTYWPYLGNGRWGERVDMTNSPRFPDGYREERVFLVDIDGDGCTDVVYFDWDRTLIWINQTGSGFAGPLEIPITPANAGARIRVADCLGLGRPGFAWSASPLAFDGCGYRFLRLGAAAPPYLLTRVDNGMGGRSEIDYGNTTAMRREDADAGRPWTGFLPLALNVVRSIREQDTVTGRATRMDIAYHDGVFDGPERAFRGFSEVTVELHGDDSAPSTRQEVTFFQGDPELDDLVERERQRALAGSLVSTRMFEDSGAGFVLRNQSSQTWEARLEFSDAKGSIYFPHITEIETRDLGTGPGSLARIERSRLLDHDAFGNVGRRQRESLADGEPVARWIRSEERYTYTTNEAAWLVKLPVRLELRDGDGAPFAVKVSHYDGDDFVGLAEGAADRGLLTRTQELRLLQARLPADYVGDRDLLALGYTLAGSGDTAGYYADSWAVARDARGNVARQRDALGRLVTIIYDGDGVYPERSHDVLGRETTFTFEPRAGEPARVSLPDGRAVRYEHDPLGRLVASFETDDDDVEQLMGCWRVDVDTIPTSITSIAPTAPGRTRAELTSGDPTALGGVSLSRQYYDGYGNRDLQISSAPAGPLGERRFVTKDRPQLNTRSLAAVRHAPVFVSSLAYFPCPAAPDASAVRFRYDVDGNVVETAGPGPAHHRVVRDTFTIHHYAGPAAGAFGAATPPGPSSRTERFDARGRLVRIEQNADTATVVTTSYDLTLSGRIAAVRDDLGVAVTYDFAGPGDPIRIGQRDVGARTYYRDGTDNLAEYVDTDGGRMFHRYDSLGRLVAIEHQPAGAPTATVVRQLIFDADPDQPSAGRFLLGRIAVAREAGAECRYSYNRRGKTVREESTAAGVTLAVGWEFSHQSHTSAVRYPDGRRVEYTLDDDGTVLAVPGVADQLIYGPDGALLSYRLANGMVVEQPLDAASRRLDGVTASIGATVLRHLGYRYDDIGNITGIDDQRAGTVEQHGFAYDGLQRLRSWTRGADTRAYGYDLAGNLTRLEETEALDLRYQDGARPGRLTEVGRAVGSQAVSYDGRGAIRAFGNLSSIEYDAFARVTRVVTADGTIVRTAYDAQSRRLLKEVTRGSGTSRVRYAAALFEQYADHVVRNIYLDRLLLASERVGGGGPAAPLYFLADRHGTLLLATDAAGAVVHDQRYSPFGQSLDAGEALDRYLGRERDVETGLIHLGARHYSPALGRFISPDWWVLENPKKPTRLPQGFNLYGYALNNPLLFKDPSGLWFGIDDLIVAAVGFVVGFVTGLIYGLANGQGWGSLLTALETGLTTAAGAWLGWTVAGPLGAVMGGLNGLLSGIHGIYDWTSIDGWFAFASDSTWGLLGTSLGNIVQIINLFEGAKYREDLSHRQNRHVWENGFYLNKNFAFTEGNVISNAATGGPSVNTAFISNHETLHIWQNRFFGPLFQGVYIVWAVGGFIVGSVYWLFNSNHNYGDVIETAAYYDNPFEYWAYKNDNNWPPGGGSSGGFDSSIAWG